MVGALALASIGLGQQFQKTLVIDDFTAGPWSWTLYQNQSIDHIWLNLDRRHCVFGNRTVVLGIVSNPNQTRLNFRLGDHEHTLTSPLQVAWEENALQYGNDAPSDVDLSAVDRFLLDFHTVPSGTGPDAMTLKVHDAQFHYGSIGWNGRPGGVYFDKKYFPKNIDWQHITYLGLQQDFNHLPNPTTYSVTNFYATLKPGLSSPGFKVGG